MIFLQRSDGAYVAFEGMSQATISEMLLAQGLSGTFIDQATYQAAISAQQ